MSRRILVALIGLAAGFLAGPEARAGLIYQSAAAVVTSTRNDAGMDGVGAYSWQYSGVTFRLTSATRVTSIGGHFANPFGAGNDEIFGAILAASGPSSVPSMGDVAGGALASTLIKLPGPVPGIQSSDTLSGSLDVTLGPGFYSVIFGSGLFGATGSGLAVASVHGPTFDGSVNSGGVSTYSVAHLFNDTIYVHNPGARYFVNGTAVVPEPSSLLLAVVGLSGVAALRRRSARSDEPRRVAVRLRPPSASPSSSALA